MENVNSKKLSGVGIDLGTTNSVIAFVNLKPSGGLVSKVVNVPRMGENGNSVKFPTLPSCVYYPQDGNLAPVVGDFAKHQYALRPQLVARSIKSQMGEKFAIGLSEAVRDKTPAEIAANILRHIRVTTEKQYRTSIKNAVITVPANFDAAMCKATLEAAKLAGFETSYADGSERPLLLSEPNAVLYDLINQMTNGEIPDSVLDLSTPKYVMVFDLGGGTLDITLHKVQYRDEDCNTIKVEDIATNRYTLLGGDDFDRAIAEAMFQRYLRNNARFGAKVVEKLQKDKAAVMPQFLTYAEALKIDLSNSQSQEFDPDDAWADDEEELTFEGIGGNLGNGYSYDDVFTKAELEAVLEKFMGREITLKDYAKASTYAGEHNIISPILDVLAKAEQKLGQPVEVNEIVLNGGMSRFYMVVERLKEFFHLEPIMATDPDQAVARGAAVYHYYLQQNERALREDMRLLGDNVVKELQDKEPDAPLPHEVVRPLKQVAAANRVVGIDWGRSILNDALYLGVQNGAKVKELIPTGQELPYESEIQKGFKIEAGHKEICLPIQAKDTDGSIRNIVKGHIRLSKAYSEDVYVAFKITMSSSKVLTMKAWIARDLNGEEVLETATVCLEIGHGKLEDKGKLKLIPPLGSSLNANNEIQCLLQYCGEGKNCKKKGANDAKRIKNSLEQIKACSNKKDFAAPILNALRRGVKELTATRLVNLARSIGADWSDLQKRELAEFCMNQLGGEMSGFGSFGNKVNLNVACIMALGMCGSSFQLSQVKKITNPKYTTAMIYTFGRAGVEQAWLWERLQEEIEKVVDNRPSYISSAAYALGNACRKDLHPEVVLSNMDEVAVKLAKILEESWMIGSDCVCVILAMAWICDQRFGSNAIQEATLKQVVKAIDDCGRYSTDVYLETAKARGIAEKLLKGQDLTVAENEYLLKLAEGYEN